MKDVGARMLGPREKRTLTQPSFVMKDQPVGGIAFERGTTLPVHTNQGKRCYATSLTVQSAKGALVQPSVNLRDPRPDDPKLLEDFNKVRN